MEPFAFDDPRWKPGDDERALEESLMREEDRIRRGDADSIEAPDVAKDETRRYPRTKVLALFVY